MAGLWVAILILVGASALILVLGLVLMADVIIVEYRSRRLQDQEEVPALPERPILYDQDAEEG